MLVLAPLLLALVPDRNVLLVVLDDVAQADVDELSVRLQGLGLPCTLDALAAQGLTFPRAYANPVCSPSRRSLFFADWYFNESGIGCNPLPGAEPPDALVSIAELAGSGGLASSGLFGKWHLGGAPSGASFLRAPLEHGFTTWIGTPGNMNSCGGTSYTDWALADASMSSLVITGAYNPLEIEQRMTSWIAATPGEKLVVWSMSLAHAPFHKPPASVRKPGYPTFLLGQREQYLAMLAACDHQLGRVLAGLDLDDWLVMVVGDNGTPQNVAPEPEKAKTSTFERGVRVPFILAGAGITQHVSKRLVHLTDVLPTVAEYLGVAPPGRIEGLSVVGARQHVYVLVGQSGGWFGGNPNVPGDWAAVGLFGGGVHLKLRRTGLPNQRITEELYDLNTDPNERSPLPNGVFTAARSYLRNRLLAEGLP